MTPETPAPAPSPKRSCQSICLTMAVLLLVLLGSAAWYLVSPRRDLEMVLQVASLPASLHHLEVTVDTTPSYAVRAYFEITPQDMEKVLSARAYENMPLQISFPSHGHKPTLLYSWQSGDKRTSCRIQTDDSKQWASLEYATE